MIKRLGFAVLLFCLGSAHAFALIGHPGGGALISYSDLCSQANVTCVYAYSVVHRLNSANTTPFTITRTSDGHTYNASYTGASYYVDVAAEEAFCLGNGGTTTVTTNYTTYNDCAITQLNDQAGSCNLVPAYANKKAPFDIWNADGYPVILSTVASNGSSAPAIPWLTNVGCSAVAGAAAKSLITYNNTAYPSGCCGEMGLMENGVGNPPSYPVTAVLGSMFAQMYWTDFGTLLPNALFAPDFEGANGFVGTTVTVTPITAGVGIITYSGGTNKVNDYYNNVQGDVNTTPTHAVNTQSRMTVGCDGDIQDCGPFLFRDMAITSNDVSATGGLPAAIYTYLTNIYAGL